MIEIRTGLVAKTKTIIDEVKALMNKTMMMSGFTDTLKNMGQDEFETFQQALKLVDLTEEYSVEAAEKLERIETIEKELDRLNSKMDYVMETQKEILSLLKKRDKEVKAN